MRLPRIEQAIQACEDHLVRASASGTEIEAHLTRAMLVLTCAVFEETIEALLHERACTLPEPCMQTFFKSCVDAVLRGIRTSDLSALLGKFGAEFKESFKRRLEAHEKSVVFYNNIVTNRHQVAHTEGLNVTLRELREFYEKGHIVLDNVRDTIAETR